MDNIPFVKYTKNPVFGSIDTGTCFDVYVTHQNGRYRMDFSWRAKSALAVTFSSDGINWEPPQITLESDASTGWEDNINRDACCRCPTGNTGSGIQDRRAVTVLSAAPKVQTDCTSNVHSANPCLSPNVPGKTLRS